MKKNIIGRFCCYRMRANLTCGLYIFHPIFHIGFIVEQLVLQTIYCTKQENSSIFVPKICGLLWSRGISDQERGMVCFFFFKCIILKSDAIHLGSTLESLEARYFLYRLYHSRQVSYLAIFISNLITCNKQWHTKPFGIRSMSFSTSF